MSLLNDFTFAIIKPDAVSAGNTGGIIQLIEKSGFFVKAMKKVAISSSQAETFYAVHKEKSFFRGLVQFMSSGPVVVMILEKENAVASFRSLIGSTNPKEAENNTIRYLFGSSLQQNAVHGSDSAENAQFESLLFFNFFEIL